MRYCTGVLAACGALAWLATPAWAHPGPGTHVHGVELVALLAVAGALLALRRFRSRAG